MRVFELEPAPLVDYNFNYDYQARMTPKPDKMGLQDQLDLIKKHFQPVISKMNGQIFGGFVRDLLQKEQFNDVDINLPASYSATELATFIEESKKSLGSNFSLTLVDTKVVQDYNGDPNLKRDVKRSRLKFSSKSGPGVSFEIDLIWDNKGPHQLDVDIHALYLDETWTVKTYQNDPRYADALPNCLERKFRTVAGNQWRLDKLLDKNYTERIYEEPNAREESNMSNKNAPAPAPPAPDPSTGDKIKEKVAAVVNTTKKDLRNVLPRVATQQLSRQVRKLTAKAGKGKDMEVLTDSDFTEGFFLTVLGQGLTKASEYVPEKYRPYASEVAKEARVGGMEKGGNGILDELGKHLKQAIDNSPEMKELLKPLTSKIPGLLAEAPKEEKQEDHTEVQAEIEAEEEWDMAVPQKKTV